ncbi:hypothetical protein BH10BAC5_BH10BAC5_13710 [soil metagenome]
MLNPFLFIKKKMIIRVNDKMQNNYCYHLTEPVGKNFDLSFNPDLTPAEMLELGVFGGRYMRDCKNEFPSKWFKKAKLLPEGKKGHDKMLNYFKVDASQSLNEWQRKKWIDPQDPRGWFQWYCRYYMGRRSEDDERQIKRWKAMYRHIMQIVKNCRQEDLSCRPRQRQALLHWAYDSRII